MGKNRTYRNTPYTPEEVLAKIQEKLPYITEIKGFVKTRHKCEFFDSREGGGWFNANASSLLMNYCLGHHNLKPKPNFVPLEEMIKRVSDKYPYIKYCRGYKGFKSKCTFLDTRSEKEFETTPARVVIGDCKGAAGHYKKPTTPEHIILERIGKIRPHIIEIVGYKNVHSKCFFKDSRNGKYFESTPHQILGEITYGHPNLSNQRSKPEDEILLYVKEELGLDAFKKRVDRFEIDIFVPSKNIGIEFNGLYWHSDKYKARHAHADKTRIMNTKGIKIVHIWEHEWLLNKNHIKSFLRNILGKNRELSLINQIFRQLTTEEFGKFAAEVGLDIGDYDIAIGCFDGARLVGVSTFKRSGTKLILKRMYFKSDVNIPYVADGFASEAIDLCDDVSEIIAYADFSKRGDYFLFSRLWKKARYLKPKPFYWDKKRKKIIKKPSRSKNIFKVWDCGSHRMVYKKQGPLL